MSPADIAAYIGAAAWLPQIGRWVLAAFTRPKLTVVCPSVMEVGYTQFGPIVNLRMFIRAERRDVLIQRITLTAVHERGESHLLTWKWLQENQSQLIVPGQDPLWFRKHDDAVALPIPNMTTALKFVGFRDDEFQSAVSELNPPLDEEIADLDKSPDRFADELGKSKAFIAARDYFRDSMYWKEGGYTMKITLYEASLPSPYQQTYKFKLSKKNIVDLRANADQFETAVRNRSRSSESGEDSAPPPAPLSWNWAYPTLELVD
jgi:hypothetical protein